MRYLITLISSLLLFTTVHSFEPKRVILSTNDDPRYIEFWPVVAPVWQAMGLRPTLALIASEDCPIDTSIGDVLRFDPLPDVPEHLQAQAIRLLIPAFFPDDICLISDIDMLPMNPTYFFEWSASCPEDTFLVYRDQVWPECHRFAMCYNAAKGSLFGKIFGVSSLDDVPNILRSWHERGLGWETDELVLYDYITEWEKSGHPVMRLGHGVGPRLDRGGGWEFDYTRVDVTSYHDCHCPRPYSMYKASIDTIVEAILANLKKNP